MSIFLILTSFLLFIYLFSRKSHRTYFFHEGVGVSQLGNFQLRFFVEMFLKLKKQLKCVAQKAAEMPQR